MEIIKNNIDSFNKYVRQFDKIMLSETLLSDYDNLYTICLKIRDDYARNNSLILTEQFKNGASDLLDIVKDNLQVGKQTHEPIFLEDGYEEALINFEEKGFNWKVLFVTNETFEAYNIIKYKYNNLQIECCSIEGEEVYSYNIDNQDIITNINDQVIIRTSIDLHEYEEKFYASEDLKDYFVPECTGVDVDKKFKYKGGNFFNKEDTNIDSKEIDVDSIVYTKDRKESYKITSKLKEGTGGEGSIFKTNKKSIIIKIYAKDISILNNTKFNKIKYMVENQVDEPHIIWPKEAIYDDDNKFVGYSMKYVNGCTLLDILHQKKVNDELSSKFGIYNISRMTLVQIILSILSNIAYLHDRNIIVGDLKLDNIMIDKFDHTKAFLIDCDSFQVGSFAATGYTPEYLAPELKDYDITKYYRTFESDNYSIFALLFMILNKATYPYSQIHLKEDLEEIDKAALGIFPYFLNEEQTKEHAPKMGYASLNWAHLPGYVKKAFYHEGNRNGKYFKPKDRLSVYQWIYIFENYLEDLSNGRLEEIDNECESGIFWSGNNNIDYSLVDLDFCIDTKNIKDIIVKKPQQEIKKYRGVALKPLLQQIISTEELDCKDTNMELLELNLKNNLDGNAYTKNYIFHMLKDIGCYYEISYENR